MIVIILITIALLAAGILWNENQKEAAFQHPRQKKLAWGIVFTSLIGAVLLLFKNRRRY